MIPRCWSSSPMMHGINNRDDNGIRTKSYYSTVANNVRANHEDAQPEKRGGLKLFKRKYPVDYKYLQARRKSSAALELDDMDYEIPMFSNQKTFPSLIIGANGRIVPQGSFAEAQAEFLDPDPDAVVDLSAAILQANMGVVAHYYMDVELQGILDAIKTKQLETTSTPFIAVADSLAMGDLAVQMAKNGATSIACLGVDFMAESVAAILTKNGFGHVPVYRATSKAIGCSLAESAERDSYRAWLHQAASSGTKALHVVYINTSLHTKATSAATVPTITCTSSNVLNTILQASAQIEDLKVYYGPDTYMGENLQTMLQSILDGGWSDDKIARELHPQHGRASLQKLRDDMEVFQHGNCVVHHMFGGDVVEIVKRSYPDAFVTAHLEVPGEMFEIAMTKSLDDKGNVGSTSDILKFIARKVEEVASTKVPENQYDGGTRLKFILGTEAGMVTSIVRSVQEILNNNTGRLVEAEIIFPVASEAVTVVEEMDDDLNLKIVPGVSGGEGCSTAGGCATCPFMKMNDLDALSDIVDMVLDGNTQKLKGHLPPVRLHDQTINGQPAAELGVEPIMYMREFMQTGVLADSLVKKIHTGVGAAVAASR